MKRLALSIVILALLLDGCGVVSPETAAQEELAFIRKTLAETLGIPESQLKNDVPLDELDPPMNEIDFVELLMNIEDHFEISLPAEEMKGYVTGATRPMVHQNTLNSIAVFTHQQREKQKRDR